MSDPIQTACAWVTRFDLAEPLLLGHWTIPYRRYAVLELTTEAGHTAAAYALIRDIEVADALAAAIEAAIAREPASLKTDPGAVDEGDPATTRATALLDACAWDLTAQQRQVPLWRLLAADDAPPEPPPARGVAVCGYPVGGPREAAEVGAEAARALADGYLDFKIPGLGSPAEIDERLAAICELDPRAAVIVDLEAAQTEAAPVLEMARSWEGRRLLWLEDPCRPAYASILPELIEGVASRVAIGDEWYAPELRELLPLSPRPLLRLDFSTLGGLSVAREIALAASEPVAQHIYPELHRHLVHAGLAVSQLDVYRDDPVIDFADRMLGGSAFRGGVVEAPTTPGPCMRLDHELVDAHATWSRRREAA